MRTLGIDLSSLPKNTAICWISWDDGKAVVDEIKDNMEDRKSTRLNSSHSQISYAVFCLKKKKKKNTNISQLLVISQRYQHTQCEIHTALRPIHHVEALISMTYIEYQLRIAGPIDIDVY